jgi:quercetin dioxygenase-like cupin family protein
VNIMQGTTILKALAVACVGAFFTACRDEVTAPASPAAQAPSASLAANLVTSPILPAPFTARAALDPFFINQPSEMMIRTDRRTDFVIQRVVSDPGAGRWHVHPGPSFGIVKQGAVMITRWSKKDGCVSTTYQTGEAYYEVAGEVHRATVVSDVPAVEYKARFYAPVNGAFTTFIDDADAPDCGTA